jgi:hypothetical protein
VNDKPKGKLGLRCHEQPGTLIAVALAGLAPAYSVIQSITRSSHQGRRRAM